MPNTQRLLLRPIVPDDLHDLHAYSREPNVGPRAGWAPHKDEAESLEIMEAIFMGQEGIWGMVLRSSGRLIGTIGLVADPKRTNPHTRMLGYAMSEHCWGRGLMTEAARAVLAYGFEELVLELISAYCYPDNPASARVLEKLGFTDEGLLRRSEEYYDGTIRDERCFSLTREEYLVRL